LKVPEIFGDNSAILNYNSLVIWGLRRSIFACRWSSAPRGLRLSLFTRSSNLFRRGSIRVILVIISIDMRNYWSISRDSRHGD